MYVNVIYIDIDIDNNPDLILWCLVPVLVVCGVVVVVAPARPRVKNSLKL